MGQLKQLISREYRNQCIELHGEDPAWGTTSTAYFEDVMKMVEAVGAESILDYGCGKGRLIALIKDAMASEIKITPEGLVRVDGYDPAVQEYAEQPIAADLVVCTDVLEHIEPRNLETVLDHLAALTIISGYLIIATGPAKALLPDGRNAHLIQEGEDFWIPKLKERFDVVECEKTNKVCPALLVRVWK